jgi:iron complex outermembrane recepter protein
MAFRSPTHRSRPAARRTPVAAAALLGLAASAAWAQTAAPGASEPTLRAVTIDARSAAPLADVGGFGDIPLSRSPYAATVIDAGTIADTGARRLSDLYRLDASVSDAYNAPGYWDYATVRGFVLDPVYNFRREGLPISAETTLPLEAVERVEILKGTSGIQAGTSAPGGLINFVVKRPTEKNLRTVRLETTHRGGLLAHVDLGGRFGADRRFGYRLNAAAEDIASAIPGNDGRRHLLALAMDWRVSRDTLVEAEFQTSLRRQASVPGQSLLGGQLPVPDPRLNINTQPWSQANRFAQTSGSLRMEQVLNADWRWQAQWGTQRLRSDDRLAYPYGCYDAGTGNYYADRYCPNGDFDLYDYRSENERRSAEAAQIRIFGQAQWLGLKHQMSFGLLGSRYRDHGQPQADNNAAVGTGNVFTRPVLPADASYTDPYTLRTERATEVFAYDVIDWTPRLQSWIGLRHTRLERDSIRTDGSRATAYARSITTPWLAVAYALGGGTQLHASYGQGVESEVAPGRSRYTNAGEPLQALKSRQTEVGLKSDDGRTRWHATVFDITRPLWGDAGACDVTASCTRLVDGDQRHRGLEIGGGLTQGAWSVDLALSLLDAERRGSLISPALNGQAPTNVPDWIVRAGLRYRVASVPGLSLRGLLTAEGPRSVLPDGSVRLPSWARVDASLSYETHALVGQRAVWTLSVDNLFNRRHWQESPYQYAHVYLYPGTPRTVRLGLQAWF